MRKRDSSRKEIYEMQGSFTVEASMIMGIVLMILVAILYASFYVHDRGVAQGIVCELAAYGNGLSWENTVEQQMEKRKKELISSRFLHTEGIKVTAAKEKDQVTAAFSGSFLIPEFVQPLFLEKEKSVEKTWKRAIYDPADTIRKIRGVKYMVEGMSN